MKTIIILIMVFCSTKIVFADYKLIASTKGNGLRMDVYFAVLLSDKVSVRIVLTNASTKGFSVITKFVGGHLGKWKQGYGIHLGTASRRGIKGGLNKSSLDGRGVVFLAPNESTELPTIEEDYETWKKTEEVLKNLSVI